MNQNFKGWEAVRSLLIARSFKEDINDARLNYGQKKSLAAIAERIPKNGVIIADEVGMGKTRIAVEVARNVVKSGGRVAIIVPPGLGYQWKEELDDGGLDAPDILRSLRAYLDVKWAEDEAWFRKQVVVVSHAFTNWRLGKDSAAWRWALLPELYAQWRRKSGKYPRYYLQNEIIEEITKNNNYLRDAAKSIVDAVSSSTNKNPARDLMEELKEQTPWPGALAAAEYGRNESLREWLEKAVGLGLGLFDLVIIDEAHKSRGTESGLSRLLSQVILKSSSTRYLAMTATPVELNVTQWKDTLGRIGFENWGYISQTIETYAFSVKELRDRWHTEKIRDTYKEAAKKFHGALVPYLLRRDKREDPAVQKFNIHSNMSIHDYRKIKDIQVHVDNLSLHWRKAICAAESLSMATCNTEDPVAKRLRLTLGNGHGIATWLNDKKTIEQESNKEPAEDRCEKTESISEIKRRERIAWWTEVIEKAFQRSKEPMFDHPAIMAAVAAIEKETAKGEKVLVFGRFTRPMRRLVDLLNARKMLRCLLNNKPWPQAKVHGDISGDADSSQWPAVRAALKQMNEQNGPVPIKESEIDQLLEEQYSRIEAQRKKFRANLIPNLEEGFRALEEAQNGETSSLEKPQAVFNGFQRCCRQSAQSEDNNLALVARALFEIRDYTDEVKPIQIAKDFCDLVGATSDKDDPDADANGDGIIDEFESKDLWERLRERLQEEFKTNQSSYARLMYGNTSPASRRIIQLAFNRANSATMVLVAQSTVGREGLNLHKCCRIVVMLHPEWNPGVVEQQIGRVDRVGSHWCKQLDRAIESGSPADQLPRIEVRPVIFKGTYDEYNWKVLIERWDDLRAQLHGIIIPPSCVPDDNESREIIERISKAAPNFSPNASLN